LNSKPYIERLFASEGLIDKFPGGSDSNEFWIWLNTEGIERFSEVKDALAPFPHSDLMQIVSGMTSEIEFARSGSKIFRCLTEVLQLYGCSWNNFSRILDFACGCGRVSRLLQKYADQCEIVGSDINQDHISWLNDHLGFGKFYKNGSVPPSPFDSGHFDLVFCISLFSHLNESAHLLWLEELRRITQRDKILVLTTHGQRALEVLNLRPDICSKIGLSELQLNEAREKMSSDSYAFIRQEDSYIDKDSYGFTFIPTAYVRRVWSRYFTVLGVEHGAIENWQDAVVLRPL